MFDEFLQPTEQLDFGRALGHNSDPGFLESDHHHSPQPQIFISISQLTAGYWQNGWLVGWLVSRVCRASRVCPRAAEGRQARLCARRA